MKQMEQMEQIDPIDQIQNNLSVVLHLRDVYILIYFESTYGMDILSKFKPPSSTLIGMRGFLLDSGGVARYGIDIVATVVKKKVLKSINQW